LTNHRWGGYWIVANPAAWSALPKDVQAIAERIMPKYIGFQRRDIALLEKTLLDQLARQGMVVNQTDSDAFRARLGPYYARWKVEFGPGLWALLEDYSGGKLS
jgi:TRAP-type C4-dicarboxylate transport system substrate-binding protein